MDTAPPKTKRVKKALNEPVLNYGTTADTSTVEMTLPIKTVSEGNCFEHWQKKHARHKDQKRAIMFAMLPIKEKLRLPCKLTMTRFAPRELDRHDNLPMSMKWIVDQCCAELTGEFKAGKADSDTRISFAYDQVKSKTYAVKVRIDF